ncbi:MAG TPA: TetR/AcrR family transcriptional regulator [Devosiaceae bacterium]|jgi:TetR/AcrR family transcriptional regulator|nr:TetR/AcrR family transcriptional regulator [Devosiaceae bacterium]
MATTAELARPRAELAEGSRQQLLSAARTAFAEGGLEGARVDDIARRAGTNKQLVYHYFGSKDGLYAAVLEQVYHEIRELEVKLNLEAFPAEEAMRKLVEFSFDYLAENPDFVRILADENAHGGRHLQASATVEEMNRPIIELISRTLERGMEEGIFRRGLDPLHVYLSIAGMSFFYFANVHTLSRAFNRELREPSAVAERRAHIVDFALNAIRSRGPAD